MDFYEVSSREMTKLSRTEQSIVKYVIKNMAETAQMSIRELSEKCFFLQQHYSGLQKDWDTKDTQIFKKP